MGPFGMIKKLLCRTDSWRLNSPGHRPGGGWPCEHRHLPPASRALAAGRSPSCTRSGTMLPLAGQKNASASPKAAAIA